MERERERAGGFYRRVFDVWRKNPLRYTLRAAHESEAVGGAVQAFVFGLFSLFGVGGLVMGIITHSAEWGASGGILLIVLFFWSMGLAAFELHQEDLSIEIDLNTSLKKRNRFLRIAMNRLQRLVASDDTILDLMKRPYIRINGKLYDSVWLLREKGTLIGTGEMTPEAVADFVRLDTGMSAESVSLRRNRVVPPDNLDFWASTAVSHMAALGVLKATQHFNETRQRRWTQYGPGRRFERLYARVCEINRERAS